MDKLSKKITEIFDEIISNEYNGECNTYYFKKSYIESIIKAVKEMDAYCTNIAIDKYFRLLDEVKKRQEETL